jgi:hypothetical protein
MVGYSSLVATVTTSNFTTPLKSLILKLMAVSVASVPLAQ